MLLLWTVRPLSGWAGIWCSREHGDLPRIVTGRRCPHPPRGARRAVTDPQCLICSTAWIYINSRAKSVLRFSRKVLLFCFLGFVEQCVKPAHVFCHLLREAWEPWGMGSPSIQNPFNLEGRKEDLKVDHLPRDLGMITQIDVQQPQTEF